MGSKVLIIDDNKGDNALIRELLLDANADYDVLVAESAEDGIRMAQRESPRLVFLDTVLPGWDGYKVCQEIKSNSSSNMHVIMMTGKSNVLNETMAKDIGADGTCLKSSESILKALVQYHQKDTVVVKSKVLKILLIEDNLGDAKLMEEALQDTGLASEIKVIDSAENIVNEVLTYKPDLMFMDVMLPGIPGGDAVRMLKHNIVSKDIPIVFLTGVWTKKDEKDPTRGIKIEGQIYPTLAKPIDAGKLREIVKICLKK